MPLNNSCTDSVTSTNENAGTSPPPSKKKHREVFLKKSRKVQQPKTRQENFERRTGLVFIYSRHWLNLLDLWGIESTIIPLFLNWLRNILVFMLIVQPLKGYLVLQVILWLPKNSLKPEKVNIMLLKTCES